MKHVFSNLYPICREHYGKDKSNHPDLPAEDYYWIDDDYGYDYGWNESDSALRKRIIERINQQSKQARLNIQKCLVENYENLSKEDLKLILEFINGWYNEKKEILNNA